MEKENSELLNEITDFYLNSNDYNGYPLFPEYIEDSFESILALIKKEKVTLYWDPDNPHIKRFSERNLEFQINKLAECVEDKDVAREVCLYPSKKHLRDIVPNNRLSNKPFERMLLLGNAHLEPSYFEPSVMYEFRDKPNKYTLSINGVSGSLLYQEEDSSFIKTFGFGLNKDLKNYEVVIAVFTRYLADLAPLEQKVWRKYLQPNQENYFLHPDYAIMTMGRWDFKESLYKAFLEEIKVINAITQVAYGKKLFREEYSQADLPLFSYILIPSVKEYLDFVRLVNNILIDNIDKKFFKDFSIKGYKEKGTITLLEEWLQENIIFEEEQSLKEMFSFIRKELRKDRSKASHNEQPNLVDLKYFRIQRDFIVKCYKIVRNLRRGLYNNLPVESVCIPIWLLENKVRFF